MLPTTSCFFLPCCCHVSVGHGSCSKLQLLPFRSTELGRTRKKKGGPSRTVYLFCCCLSCLLADPSLATHSSSLAASLQVAWPGWTQLLVGLSNSLAGAPQQHLCYWVKNGCSW
jgi:hypothetical protein